MKWQELIQKMYAAIRSGDADSERKLWFKAMKKNFKDRTKGKKNSASKTIIR